jgi:putative RecB family exonuclease
MNISEFLKIPHLSSSSLTSYVECGLAYKFAKVDRLKPEFIPDALAYGSTIHKTLENYYYEKKSGIVLTLNEIHDCFEELWNMEAGNMDDIQYSEGKNFEAYLVAGKDLLSAWFDKLPKDDFKILGIEEGFVFYVPGLDIPIVGFIDLLEEDENRTVILTDFKTAGKIYSSDEIDKNIQLTLYQLAMKSNGYADREILLKLDCLIKTKTPKFEQYYTTRSSTDELRLIRKIQQVWEGINKGIFLPNDTSWKCKGCQYQKACENWFMKRSD